jgi:hypothetical protein
MFFPRWHRLTAEESQPNELVKGPAPVSLHDSFHG